MSKKEHRIPRSRSLLAVSALLIATLGHAQTDVDVQREIWPVIREHCLQCHGPAEAKGQLRLDHKSWIDRGGHTGNAILGTVDDSELLRRLRSSDRNYRMPKGADPLADETIQAFERWIAEGAPWPDDRVLAADVVPTGLPPGADESSFQRALEIREGLKSVALPALLLFGGLLVLERRKRQAKTRGPSELGTLDRLSLAIRPSHYLVLVLILAVAALWTFHRSEVAHLEAINRRHLATLERYNITPERRFPSDHTFYPQPDRPRHPLRLGGTYYRGNDERNPELFNGGYYRTATMQLSLRDARNEKLKWNDAVEPGPLLIDLEIERAPFATPELFRDEMMRHNRLTRHVGGEETRAFARVIRPLEVVEPGNRWRADYPIAEPTRMGDESFSGMVYLCNIHGRAHYGIRYDIRLQDGTISADSELWMGATMFSGHFLRPPADVMSAHEWFGFLPLPEIEGGNTDDPVLLGIPEHLPEATGETQNGGE